MSQTYVCPDANYDSTTGACSAGVWVDSSSLSPLPPLSSADAFQIGFAVVCAWVAGAMWRWIGQAMDAY